MNARSKRTLNCRRKDKRCLVDSVLIRLAARNYSSVRHNATATPRFANQEYKRNHRHGYDREYVEVVDVGQRGALPL